MLENVPSARRSIRSAQALALAAALAMSAGGRVARAQSLASDNQSVYFADEAPDGLLQTKMREYGLGGSLLEEYGIKLKGYAEAGYSFNFDRTAGRTNSLGHLFTDKSDDPMLNQISLSLSRDVIASADRFDTGFQAQVIYGSDARYTQANGTNFYGSNYAGQRGVNFFTDNAGNPLKFFSGPSFQGQQRPDEQIDLLQLYLTLNFPIGNGLVVKAGKFVTPWGEEKTNPTENGLYSHSYIFSVSTPKTLTGVLATYNLDEQ